MGLKLAIIHGPNLNLLGEREKSMYGDVSFSVFLDQLKKDYPQCDIDFFQSNSESELVNFIQNMRQQKNGFIINPAAFTHSSIAIRDAILAVRLPGIEVHLSDIYSRESFRHHSYIKDVCICSIVGKGLYGYRIALSRLIEVLAEF